MLYEFLHTNKTCHVTDSFASFSIILIECCIFSNISYSEKGGVFFIAGSLIVQITSQLNDHLYCSSSLNGGVYYIDAKYNGNFSKNLFFWDFSKTSGMTFSVTNGANSSVIFELNTISYCPRYFEGSLFVLSFYNGEMVFKCLNCSHCSISRHTMFDTFKMNFIHLYNYVNHNKMGCVYRSGGEGNGAIDYSNHVNNTVQNTDWGFVHDYTGKAIVFNKCLFYSSNHSSFPGYDELAYYINSVVFQCRFGIDTVSITPTQIMDIAINCNTNLPEITKRETLEITPGETQKRTMARTFDFQCEKKMSSSEIVVSIDNSILLPIFVSMLIV